MKQKFDEKKLNELIDYCLESFFDGAVNVEENTLDEGLPPGFDSSDIETPDEYLAHNLEEGDSSQQDDTQLLPYDYPGFHSPTERDFDTTLQAKKEKGGKSDWETPYIHGKELKIVDDNGDKIDLDYLKRTITHRPDRLLKQNAKISKSGGRTFKFYNVTLPAYKGLWYDEKRNEFRFVTTCPSAGDCKLVCYARKGGFVQYPASFVNSSRTINFLLNDWKGFKDRLLAEINAAKTKHDKKQTVTVIRWHDSGDFFNEKYLEIAFDIARSTPAVIHYAYTKSVAMVTNADKPNNFTFNFSFGGLQDVDIDPSKKVAHVVKKDMWLDLTVTEKIPVFKKDGSPKIDKKTQAPVQKKFIRFSSPEALDAFKQRVMQKFNITDPQNIILYSDLLKIPYNKDNPNIKPKYHVIVKTGDGDDAAMRKDVKTVLLLIH